MVRAWSFSGGSQGPLNRLVSALALDGHRLATEITVRFNRSVSAEAAESLADEVAAAATEVLGEQICQGEVPLARTELETRVCARLRGPVSRLVEIHVASLTVVTASGPSRSTYRARASQPALAIPPTLPAERPSSAPPPRDSSPPPKPTPSGEFRMLWQQALSNLAQTATLEQAASRFGPALRDSTAAAIYRIVSAVDPAAIDRFALLDGRAPIPELRAEACACFAAGMHRVLVQSSLAEATALSVVSIASRRALFPDTMPVAHIERYIASNGPVRELSYKAAALLGVPNDAVGILTSLSQYCEALRAELRVVATDMARFAAA